MEQKIKHLEFIQSAISRMANNSFLLKGWAVTLTGGLLALTFKETNRHYLLVSLVVLMSFWLLDSYYLSRERKFIALYDTVRIGLEGTDFSMDTGSFGTPWDWAECAFSKTMVLFYGGLFAVHLLVYRFL
jgi:hypothetical protein